MPELPEVETYRRYFDKHALGKRIRRVEAPSGSLVFRRSPIGEIEARLRGRAFTETQRWGKWLFAGTGQNGPWLVLHFGMTGDLEHRRDGSPSRHARFVIHFANGAALS